MSVIDDLIAAGRTLVDAGLSPGSSGNVSVRDGDRLLMSGTGTRLGELTVHDIAVLDARGVARSAVRPSKEVSLHVAMYERTPEHTAVVHVHSPSTVALSCLQPWADHSAVPPLTPYALMRVGQVPLLDYVPPGDPAMGDLIRDCPHPFRAALLANHGAVVGGVDLAGAVDSAIELEEACRITLLTHGMPRRLIAPDQVRALTARWGTPWSEPASVS
ncbi:MULTISPECIES: class II aldolase/adducin family protein [Microbacterium]|uniref:class II aldolase/adducin family protein n=1 Tax=Microbacterium TaxID=33882 RepID=UPI00277F88FE|nr:MULTISPECIES: class II aldolase/adducin family protein [Microbacterium]MDQ1082456.1 ribulose-5-phosphate 4-epimerase/fuculose-1-phosphate aldolase [Microbacterium sp. SORGH_AS_0344]MDQ1168772.1 ribulose-5-phosphate 4-epimerase/fuculose-1-phosphate aldolase [Microbacterium proteolyticum]